MLPGWKNDRRKWKENSPPNSLTVYIFTSEVMGKMIQWRKSLKLRNKSYLVIYTINVIWEFLHCASLYPQYNLYVV